MAAVSGADSEATARLPLCGTQACFGMSVAEQTVVATAGTSHSSVLTTSEEAWRGIGGHGKRVVEGCSATAAVGLEQIAAAVRVCLCGGRMAHTLPCVCMRTLPVPEVPSVCSGHVPAE